MAFLYFLVAFFLFTSAVLSGSEAAFLAASEIHVSTLVQKKDKRAIQLEKLRGNMHRLLGVVLLGQVVSDVSASALATYIATTTFGDFGVGLAMGLMTLLVFIFGQLVPKLYGARQPEKWSLRLAGPISMLTVVLGPVLTVLEAIVRVIFGSEVHFTPQRTVSEEEIKTMASMGVKAGTLEKGEKELIERVFLFNDVTASDVMTPRESIVFLDGKKTLAEAMPVIISSEFSRYPVFENDKNNIIGIVHIKELIKRLSSETGQPAPAIRDLAEPAIFVPKTKVISDLLRDMQKQHLHMAVVVNEYGSVEGVVTFEDLLEELVGEISDESDVDEHVIKRVDKLNVIAHGDAEVKDVNRFFNVKITAPPHKSLGWVILKELGSIPVKGQQVKIADNLTATIEEMINLRINKVRLTKAEEAPAAAPENR